MKRKAIALFAGLLLIAFSACRKEAQDQSDDSDYGHVNHSSELKIPDGFSFTTTKLVNYDFSTSDIWGKEKIRIDIYDNIPSAGGELILSSFADGYGRLAGELEIAGNQRRLYVVMATPDGSRSLAEVTIMGNSLSHNFTVGKTGSRKTTVVSPTCNSGCVQSINNHSGNLNINGNDPAGVYCLTGTISGSISVQKAGVTVRICGNANVQSISLNNGANLELTDGASLVVGNINQNSSSGTITIYDADLTHNANFTPAGTVINHGDIQVNGNFVLSNQCVFENNGSIAVTGDLTNNNVLTNNYSISTDGQIVLNASSVTDNNCFLYSKTNAEVFGNLNNHGFIKCDAKFGVNSGSAVSVYNGSMVSAGKFIADDEVNGIGTTSLLKVSGITKINAGGIITGNLELCDADGIETNVGIISAPAVVACNVYIPTSPCNTEGHGTPQIVDSDNDGVADDVDLYPSDPAASGASSYPAADSYASLAFEDLWPSRGDYDFNDLVLAYRHKLVTNSSNKVVRVESEYYIRAIGGSHNKGFGFQFNIPPSYVASVTGQMITGTDINLMTNGTEQGQSKATIIVFDNSFKVIKNIGGTSFVNTVPGEAIKESDTINTVVTFTTPIDAALLGAAPFNPFIYIKNDRGMELHLVDQEPTDLMNTSFLGMGADNSNPATGDFYKTVENHPFALNIIGGFRYPVEKTDIVEAYYYFDIWAQSGGSSFPDWHLDFPGHLIPGKVY